MLAEFMHTASKLSSRRDGLRAQAAGDHGRRDAATRTDPQDGSAGVPQSLKAVEDHVERELELHVRIAPTEASLVGGRQRHLRDVRMAVAELSGEGGGHIRVELLGV